MLTTSSDSLGNNFGAGSGSRRPSGRFVAGLGSRTPKQKTNTSGKALQGNEGVSVVCGVVKGARIKICVPVAGPATSVSQ
jgi:hypothetical protein